MNRTMTALVAAAAVLGVTGGTFVATRVPGGGASPESGGRPGASTPALEPSGPAYDAAPLDPRAGQLLWIEPTAVHDGDTVARLDLPLDVENGTPVALQRFRRGWVVTELIGGDELAVARTSIITTRGGVYEVADHAGFGDVSPDGRLFVAQELDGSGYAAWDLTSDLFDKVATISAGRTPDQLGAGGAQFLDDDTVATGWSGPDGLTEVLVGDLGSDTQRPVTDGIVGDWAISPDGRWLAGSLPDVRRNGVVDTGCVVVRPVDASGAGRTDCGGRFLGMPAFAPDSGAVLTVPTGFDGVNNQGPSVFRQVPTGDRKVPDRVDGPDAGLTATYLDTDRVAVLGGKDKATSQGTRIDVCTPGGRCQVVVSSAVDNYDVVLGG